MNHPIDCGLDEDCTCTPSEETMIDLSLPDLILLSDALRAHEDFQLRDEPEVDEARWETVHALSRWLEAATPGPHGFNRAEAGEMAEALDSLMYWELSPEDCRHSGDVYDEDGETPAECVEADLLRQRFQGLYDSMPEEG